jgi:phage portal protein BeeE
LLSELGRATWGTASEMGQNFLDFCLLPWLLQWQGALTRALLTPEQQKTSFVEFDTNALTRANLAVRTESYAKAVGGPWMLANEARALENRPPIDGGDVLNEPPGTPLAANDNNIAKDAVAA